MPANYNLELYGENGNLIIGSYNSNTQEEIIIQISLPVATYHVKVYGVDNAWSPQAYGLNISVTRGFGVGIKDPIIPINPPTPVIPPVGGVKNNNWEYFNFKQGNDLSNFMLYPNPTKDFATIEIFAQQEDDVELTVNDMTGRVLRTSQETIHTGKNQITLELNNLTPGQYIVKCNGVHYQWQKRLVIIK